MKTRSITIAPAEISISTDLAEYFAKHVECGLSVFAGVGVFRGKIELNLTVWIESNRATFDEIIRRIREFARIYNKPWRHLHVTEFEASTQFDNPSEAAKIGA